MSGRHSNGSHEDSQHEHDEDLSHTAEMDAIPAEAAAAPDQPEPAVEPAEEPADLGEYSLTEPAEPKRKLLRTRYVVAGAVAVGTLAIATGGVAAVHSMTAAPDKVQQVAVTAPKTTAPTPSTTPSADLRQYAGDKASRSMGLRPSPTVSPSKSSGSGGDDSGTGSGGSPVTGGGTCKASFYGEGQNTASGERFDPSKLTAAHKTLKFGTLVKVTNIKNNKTVTVRINDRGPFIAGRCLDLSTAAFKRIASTSAGVATVRYQVVG